MTSAPGGAGRPRPLSAASVDVGLDALAPTPSAPAAPQEQLRERFSPRTTWLILLCVLPMFAQCFHYYNEIPPTYALSKAWPVLTLPLTFWAIARVQLPAKSIYLVLLAYTIGITPLVSVIHLGNDFLGSITTTVKVWPITYYFGLYTTLLWLTPTDARTRSACIWLGFGTYALMLLMWLVVPTTWYIDNTANGKLLLYEQERGYRIYMPMFFGILYVFYLVRSFMQKPHVLKALGVLAAIVLMLWIYKQRTAIACVILISGYAVFASLPKRAKQLVLGACLLALPALVVVALGKMGNVSEDLGGSLSTRQNSFGLAMAYLGENVWRWVFGVGATTRFSTISLKDIFQDSSFYIADLGWVGEVFEYGVVGAFLILLVYVAGYLVVRKVGQRTGDPLDLALGDYLLYLLATSAIYPLVFTPGELGVVMAIAVYLDRYRLRAMGEGNLYGLPQLKAPGRATPELSAAGGLTAPPPMVHSPQAPRVTRRVRKVTRSQGSRPGGGD